MSSDVKLFGYKHNQVRVVEDQNGEPLFCLSDVCKVLELSTPAKTAAQIKEEFEGCELSSYPLKTAGGIQYLTLITEPQLYFVMMRSRSPKAKGFRRWVCEDVLPSIRKTRKYEIPKEQDVVKELGLASCDSILEFCIQVGLDIKQYAKLRSLVDLENDKAIADYLYHMQKQFDNSLRERKTKQKPDC